MKIIIIMKKINKLVQKNIMQIMFLNQIIFIKKEYKQHKVKKLKKKENKQI